VTTTTFDTLRAAKRLKAMGFSDDQAEGVAELIRENRELDLAQLATKTDLQLMEQRLTIRLGAMVTGGIAVVATLVGIF
jgi:hypothetical protein